MSAAAPPSTGSLYAAARCFSTSTWPWYGVIRPIESFVPVAAAACEGGMPTVSQGQMAGSHHHGDHHAHLAHHGHHHHGHHGRSSIIDHHHLQNRRHDPDGHLGLDVVAVRHPPRLALQCRRLVAGAACATLSSEPESSALAGGSHTKAVFCALDSRNKRDWVAWSRPREARRGRPGGVVEVWRGRQPAGVEEGRRQLRDGWVHSVLDVQKRRDDSTRCEPNGSVRCF